MQVVFFFHKYANLANIITVNQEVSILQVKNKLNQFVPYYSPTHKSIRIQYTSNYRCMRAGLATRTCALDRGGKLGTWLLHNMDFECYRVFTRPVQSSAMQWFPTQSPKYVASAMHIDY